MKDELKKGFVFGFGAILAVSLVVALISISGSAHGDNARVEVTGNSMMMDFDHSDMHKMMHGEDGEIGENHMGCMDRGMMSHMSELTVEEMDADGDGLCDMCGMPVEDCLEHMNAV